VRTADGVEHRAPLGAEVLDTTGAGDALAAGFLVGGIELGLEAAARCVGQLGAVPS
jgi:ribokinase